MEAASVPRLERPKYVLRLSPGSFSICWLAIMVMQGLFGAFYLSLFTFHKKLAWIADQDMLAELAPDDYAYQLMIFKLLPESKYFLRPMMLASVIVAAGHGLEIFLAVGQSLYTRQLLFQQTGGPSALSSVRTVRTWISTFHSRSSSSPHFTRVFRSWWLCIWRVSSPFRRLMIRVGRVYYSHSLTVILLLEIVEVVCQTAQAYRMSYYVSSVWLNRVFAFATAVNCWSTPCIHVLFRGYPVFERVLSMVADALLNGLQTVVIPWYVVYPYFRDTERQSLAISGTQYTSDLLTLQLDDNIRQLFPSTWLSFLAIATPAFAMLAYISAVKSSLARRRFSVFPTTKPVGFIRQHIIAKPLGPRLIEHNDLNPVGPSTGPLLTTDKEPVSHNPVEKPPAYTKELVIARAIHILLFLWGFVILGCHFYAVHVGNLAEQAGCVFQVRRWLTSEYLCSMVNISCAENHIQGNVDELDGILSRMSPLDIQEFVISDCPALEMSPRIQSFSNVTLIVIHNSTLVSWEMDAALTEDTNPSTMSLAFVEVNMSAVPPAILHPNLPFILANIIFSGTNLTEIPDDADLYWGFVMRFCLEVSPGITQVPSAISRMFALSQLSLIDDGITFIPDDTFMDNSFSLLELTGNPLNSLPTTLGINLGLGHVSVERTNITNLPGEWLELYADTRGWTILAGGTPLCERLDNGEPVVAGNDSVEVESFPVLNAWGIEKQRIICATFPVVRWFELT